MGTSIVEDMVMDREDDGRESEALELLLRARLTQAELFGVLSGVYVRYLEALDIRTRLSGVLSSEQLDWLLDNSAPHRWSDGTMEVEGAGLRFVPGPSEWHVDFGAADTGTGLGPADRPPATQPVSAMSTRTQRRYPTPSPST